MAGAKPVFVDADEKHWQMDLDQVEAAISSRCRAVIAVHLFGQPLDMERLKDICARKKVFLIEDAAQAHGATYRGARTGSFGELACFSFYPSKNLGAFGDGGAITTSNSELATKLRQLRNHGRVNKYEHGFVGYNYRMDEIQGLVLNTKLPHLDRWNEARRRVAAQYRERLADLPLFIPAEMAHTDAVYHLFTVGTPKRQELAAFLAARKIDTGVHYPVPLHIQPAFAHLGHQESDFPVAAHIGREELSLPMFPFMTENQVDWVCASVQEFWKR
jgi:dTDP-4-amino-4,6-dideoxygalactose transaminase